MSSATLPSIPTAASRAPEGVARGVRDDGGRRRTQPSWRQHSGVRRYVSALMLILFSLACGEALIADVCDGDAGSETAAVAAMAAAHGDVASSGSEPAPERPHGVHVCHCTHAHGGMLLLRAGIVATIVPVTESHGTRSDRMPPSPALDRHLRPPAFPQVA